MNFEGYYLMVGEQCFEEWLIIQLNKDYDERFYKKKVDVKRRAVGTFDYKTEQKCTSVKQCLFCHTTNCTMTKSLVHRRA